MKKLIYSRRGVAIELAIGVMFVMMALGIILVTNASLQNKQMNSDLADYEEKIEMYEITDYVIKCHNSSEELQQDYFVGYSIENVNNGKEYFVKQGDDTVLTIVFDDDGSIKSWN